MIIKKIKNQSYQIIKWLIDREIAELEKILPNEKVETYLRKLVSTKWDVENLQNNLDRLGIIKTNVTEKKPAIKIIRDNPREIKHGTIHTYNYRKCRCDKCRKANSTYEKERLAKKKNTVAIV